MKTKSLSAKSDRAIKGEQLIEIPAQQLVAFGNPKCLRVRSGWAASFIVDAEGCRQITGFHLPGDIVVPQFLPSDTAGIVALEALVVAPGSSTDYLTGLVQRVGALSTWLYRNGRRPAISRVAHLLCELHHKMSQVSVCDVPTFKMPLLQEDIGDAVGLTGVHVNRMLRELRERRLAEVAFKRVKIINSAQLRELAGFDGMYLGCPEPSL